MFFSTLRLARPRHHHPQFVPAVLNSLLRLSLEILVCRHFRIFNFAIPRPRLATAVQVNGRLMLYALGFTAVFMLVGALYWNAWRQRDALALNGIERLLTVSSIIDSLGLICIGLLAALTALVLPPSWSVYSALLYLLIAPWKTLGRVYFGRKARTLHKLVTAANAVTSQFPARRSIISLL